MQVFCANEHGCSLSDKLSFCVCSRHLFKLYPSTATLTDLAMFVGRDVFLTN